MHSTPPTRFTLITGNRHKLREARQILGPGVEGLAIELDEIQGLDEDRIAAFRGSETWVA